MREMQILSISPDGPQRPTIAIAACKAGHLGCLNLEFAQLADAQSQTIYLRRFTQRAYGIRVGLQSPADFAPLFQDQNASPAFVLITGGLDETQKAWIAFCQQQSVQILFEAVSVREAAEAIQLGAQQIVLKGNEAAGRVGHDTSFIILQKWNQFLQRDENASLREIPYWIQGGIGLHTAAAGVIAGVCGFVLDQQLLLARESTVDESLKQWIASADGSESRCIGESIQCATRIIHRPKSQTLSRLEAIETDIFENCQAKNAACMWREAIVKEFAENPERDAYLLGQDIAFAKPLADQFVTVGGIIAGLLDHVQKALTEVGKVQSLVADSPLAKSHGTKFPLLQGPMTRVSDTAEFAKAVADGGGLPFLALAVMPGTDCDTLLAETKTKLGAQPWGAGILGFLPPAIRNDQTNAILKHRPPFAIIAGGRPDQAKQFEAANIATYLHVPSPGLLKMFLRDGARRFIFEGRECGGHVGPRSSFILWETMCQVLTDFLDNDKAAKGKASPIHVVFAGGIHDALSTGMVSAMAAPLAARGVCVGGLMGTAYLFTEEAVKAGAIVEKFQQQAVECDDTVLLQTGPGHAIRCVKTPYYDVFESEKKRLIKAGKSHEEIVRTLESMNIGRLRVASKGLDRAQNAQPGVRKLESISDAAQYERGMYMIGQVAGMRGNVTTIAQLHADVCDPVKQRIVDRPLSIQVIDRKLKPSDIAIIGMDCNYPDAQSLETYWENILKRHYAVTEVPLTHWDWRLYYDPDPKARDRIYSKWGGFLQDLPFDPMRYGITPKSMEVIEPLQLLVLESVRKALADSGYEHRPFNRERTAAILGIGGGGGPMSIAYGFRTCIRVVDYIDGMPIASDDLVELAREQLPEWTEDSFPGMLGNVCAGRVANRFNLGGPNYAVDAACASSLASLDACVRELEMGTADMAIAMGADAVQTPLAYMAFSKTQALSASGRIRPFDAAGDGIVLSEGVGVVILKRLADAERDGDRIYAVIKGIGSSSDGKDKGLTAPNTVGQQRALRRAYEKANVNPARLGLVEAHGTGTVVGDQTEANSLSSFMQESGASQQSCAIGSVKSMIGHSKCAAGVAGLIKSALALHRKTLPPTLVETPNPKAKFEESALYLNTDIRPWVCTSQEPRLAGVSAFGFGGTNFHTVLEEYQGDYLAQVESAANDWASELLVWRRDQVEQIKSELSKIAGQLSQREAGSPLKLNGIAQAVIARNSDADNVAVLAIVANSLDDLVTKIQLALEQLNQAKSEINDPRGIYFRASGQQSGKVAFLFPGQGSQYPNMLAETAVLFPIVRESLDLAATELQGKLDRPIAHFIYPPSEFSDQQRQLHQQELARTEVAQPAIAAASLGIANLLKEFALRPDATAGHSFGEYTALTCAAGLTHSDLINIAFERGNLIAQAADTDSTMLAVDADEERTRAVLAAYPAATIANVNGPNQTVISLAKAEQQTVQTALETAGLRVRNIPVSHGFHSPFVADAAKSLGQILAGYQFQPLQSPVYSNRSGDKLDIDPKDMPDAFAQHLCNPVRFQDEINKMYSDGIRVFIEVGPHNVLTNLTRQVLDGKSFVAVATDVRGRSGLTQLQHCLGQLATAGLNLNLKRLFVERKISELNLDRLPVTASALPPNYWLVNGVRSKRVGAPEPLLLGKPTERNLAEQRARQNGTLEGTVNKQPPAEKSQSAKLHPADAKSPQTNPASVPIAKPAAAAEKPASQPVRKPMASTTRKDPSPSQPAANSGRSGDRMPAKASGSARYDSSPHNQQEPSTMISSEKNGMHLQPPVAHFDPCDEVMQGFQQVMAKFLETQRDVMMAYLQGDSYDAPLLPAPTQATKPTASQQTQRNQHATGSNGTNGQSAATKPVATPQAHKQTTESRAATNGESHAPTRSEGGANRLRTEAKSTEQIVPSTEPRKATAAETGLTTIEPAQAKPVGLTKEVVGNQLMTLVSERTGYPADMLDIDLDLEADLGIDSIKRVEILGSLAEFIQPDQQMGSESDINLETLSGLRTLRLIMDYLEESLDLSDDAPDGDATPSAEDPSQKKKLASGEPVSKGTPEFAKSESPAKSETPARSDSPAKSESPVTDGSLEPDPALVIRRGLIELVDAPIPTAQSTMIPSGAVLITADDQGIAAQCADRLADFGQTVVVIQHADQADDTSPYVADLCDEDSVGALIGRLRDECGPIAGVIHLLPLSSIGGESLSERARRDVKSIYQLCRALEQDLCRAGQEGNAFVLSTTMMGGKLGFGTQWMDDLVRTGAGGVNGFLKCVGMEWPEVLVRTVDFHSTATAAEIVDQLQAELGDASGPFEVGYFQGTRTTWQPVACDEQDWKSTNQLELNSSSTILITGGARGITAAIAARLAKEFQPNLILVGRSESPEEHEDPATAGLADKAELKRALIQGLQQQGTKVAPADVEAKFKRLLADREIRQSLAAMRAAGATVEYHSVDVRDAESLTKLIADIRSRYGKIDGVIHGAGIIDDKLLKDKTSESFDRVFRTKVDSTATLVNLLDQPELKFLSLFASIASRYGNRGQSDYAAANDVLCKLASELDRRWPARVFAVAWGPWSGLGMVSDLEKHLAARGIALIDPEIGSAMFVDELLHGRKGESEIIIAGGAENLVTPSRNQAASV
jgi:acyl transferase domain-containing protein/NAD(P)H-dependent flavin oxidoreductase YrpB (nitropropane dioxygenase family)/NAD(P)-dependent dehydrogenase (short-subunit alcohol dehydrogenase family)